MINYGLIINMLIFFRFPNYTHQKSVLDNNNFSKGPLH